MKRIKVLLAIMIILASLLSLASCAAIKDMTGIDINDMLGIEDGEEKGEQEDDENKENEDDEEEYHTPPSSPEDSDEEDGGEGTHVHTYSDEWSFDEDNHWHAATCEHSELKSNEAEHSFDAARGNCVCGKHRHIFTAALSYDESSHWYAPLCEHTDIKADAEAHIYDPVSNICKCGHSIHVHTYSEEWSTNDSYHWRAATCEHSELKTEEAEHEYDPDTGLCVCGHRAHVHTYSEEWSTNDTYHWHAATCEHSALKTNVGVHEYDPDTGLCKCGQRIHIHTYSDEWSTNDTHHWHAATCEHSELKTGEAAHEFDPATGNCACGKHMHLYSTEWTSGETTHWHSAICEHTDLKGDEVAHKYVKDVCECGRAEPDYGPEPADIIKGGTPVGTITELFKMSAYTDSEGRNCRVLQGGCTDGRYYYAFFNDSLKDSAGNHSPNSASICYKYDMTTKKLVTTYENLMVEHVNDATYVPDTNEIVVAHCSPNRKLLSIFDADTMTLKRQATADDEIYSIAYDEYEKCYWAGLAYANGNLKGDSFARLDLDFHTVEIFPGEAFGYTRQGMDVDSEYIYFARYTPNCVLVYDKAGNFVNRIALSQSSYELENIFHIGDTFYLGYYTSSKGGRVYSLELTDVDEAGDVYVDMKDTNALVTLSQRTDAAGNVCKVAQCSASDGTYIYFFMNNDVKTGYISSVYKYEIATGKIVATLDGFKTGHTNDVTYNPKTKELVVVHNSPAYTLTIIDAETLTVKSEIKITSDIYAIAYDETHDCYYGADRSTRGLILLDSSFNLVTRLTEGITTPYSRQAIDTDGKYVYMLQSAANCVLVYKVDGTFVGISYLLPSTNTAQSICHVGDTFYIGYNVSSSGGIIYSVEISVSEKGHTDTES